MAASGWPIASLKYGNDIRSKLPGVASINPSRILDVPGNSHFSAGKSTLGMTHERLGFSQDVQIATEIFGPLDRGALSQNYRVPKCATVTLSDKGFVITRNEMHVEIGGKHRDENWRNCKQFDSRRSPRLCYLFQILPSWLRTKKWTLVDFTTIHFAQFTPITASSWCVDILRAIPKLYPSRTGRELHWTQTHW